MPLASGSGKRVISGNIRELMHAYAKKGAIGTSHPADAKAAQKQAIAIAYSKARKRAAGGRLQPMADGGTPFYARQGSSALAKSGMIQSAVAGRTDKLPMKVRGGSYVVPADVVSGLGQGNSLAGAAGFDKMLKSGPYGADKSPGVHVKAKAIRQKFADGGEADDNHAEIIAAGGEYIIDPDQVRAIGGGDLKKGWETLDHMVLHARKKTIKQMRRLPRPKG